MDTEWAAPVAALLLVGVPPVWGVTRHVVTLVHEAGHAVAAVATGRRLTGVRLHADTSGLTVSRGRPRGPGMIATAAAGYLAPAAAGLGIVALTGSGRADLALAAALVLLGALVLYIRNWFGLLVVLLSAGVVAALVWRAAPSAQELAALVVGWFLLLGAPRTSIELWGHRRRSRSRTSDADVLARLTHVPAVVWNVVFVALTAGAAVLAARLTGLVV